MWDRQTLKRQGRNAFKRNYRKSVLIALILMIVLSGSCFALHSNTTFTQREDAEISSGSQDSSVPDGWKYKDDYQGSAGQSFNDFSNGYSNGYPNNNYGDEGQFQMPQQNPSGSGVHSQLLSGIFSIPMMILGIAAMLFSVAAGFLIRFFVLNPMEIGSKRFFLMNLKAEPAEVKEIGYTFDHSWKNAAHILFFRDLYICLWSLLLIVPGIVKFYEYRMIPYLLAENPDMTKEEVFAESRGMMQGQKFKTFVLDLSFLGWEILSVITAGIVGIFYVNPYVYSTNAALYAHLRYESARSWQNSYDYYAYAQRAAEPDPAASASAYTAPESGQNEPEQENPDPVNREEEKKQEPEEKEQS